MVLLSQRLDASERSLDRLQKAIRALSLKEINSSFQLKSRAHFRFTIASAYCVSDFDGSRL